MRPAQPTMPTFSAEALVPELFESLLARRVTAYLKPLPDRRLICNPPAVKRPKDPTPEEGYWNVSKEIAIQA
jgi:hypothetical protein